MRKQCDICRGSRVIRLPVYRPLVPNFSAEVICESIDASSREYPCPECGNKIDIGKLAVIDVHSRVSARYEQEPGFEKHARRSLAHQLIDELLRGDYIAFEKGEHQHYLDRMMVASLGVVSKSQVATIEQRIAQHQDQMARVVAEEAIKQIDNWGSHYGRTGIAKDDAAKFIRDAVRTVSETWSKARALTSATRQTRVKSRAT